MTAKELNDLLEKDQEYQAMMTEREKRREIEVALLRANERPLVEAISAAWRPVGSIDDLINTSDSYPQVIPVLADHLEQPYHPAIKDGIARALTVKEARGPAAHVVLAELKKMTEPKDTDEDGYRFALANALVFIGDSSMQADIVQLMKDPRYAKVHIELKRVIKAIVKRLPVT